MGTACGGVLLLWIQRVLGGEQFNAEVPLLKMTEVYAKESEFEGGKRNGDRC